jgi:hypothetical protein
MSSLYIQTQFQSPFPLPFPRLLTLFRNNRVFVCEDISPTRNLQIGGSGYFSISGTSLKTGAPSMVITPAARLQA